MKNLTNLSMNSNQIEHIELGAFNGLVNFKGTEFNK